MKPQILLPEPMLTRVMQDLEAEFQLHRLWESAEPDGLLAQLATSVRGIATTAGFGASSDLMDALPAVEIIACCGVGVDAIDLESARQRGIRVTNTPDVLNEDVADLAIGLMLAAARKLCEGDRFVRAGRWAGGELRLGHRVNGRRLGVLGLGRIGQAIARRAQAFDMSIAYHQRHANPEFRYHYYEDLVELARASDFLVCIVPGGEGTRHLVDQGVLEALGPTGILINVARGSVVDEQALTETLVNGRLGAAGLDVFAQEPAVPKTLLSLDNVVLAPHIGSATLETRIAMGDLMISNLRAHFAGKPLITPVA